MILKNCSFHPRDASGNTSSPADLKIEDYFYVHADDNILVTSYIIHQGTVLSNCRTEAYAFTVSLRKLSLPSQKNCQCHNPVTEATSWYILLIFDTQQRGKSATSVLRNTVIE